jgi:uncharacterized protein (TIGR02246 family)
MKSRVLCFLALPALIFMFMALPGHAEKPKGDAKDTEAIAKKGEAFVEAFDKGDARALARFWTKDGDFTDQTGHHLEGRDAIEKSLTKMFADTKGLRLHVESESLRFVSPDVAIEDGITEVIPADGGPSTKARYTIVHVKKDGEWLLSSVRNSPFTPPSQVEHLRGLDWVIGKWAGETDKGNVERLTFAWGEDQNYVVGTFSTTARNVPVASAKQWIGWDPVAKEVRSFIIDATGAFGEGHWTEDGKKWTIKTTVVLSDGKKATATFVLSSVDSNSISLQKRDQSVDGKPIPESKVVKLKRAK